MTCENNEKMLASLRKLTAYLERCEYSGWEYDDLLASPLVRLLTFKLLPLQIAAVQIAKRSFINPRPLLGVPKLKSTKASGFMVKGLLRAWQATGDDEWLKPVRTLLAWLQENQSPGYSGSCWGNDFDFASRAGFFAKGLPTVVWSSHIQDAFLLAHELLGDDVYLAAAVSVADFVCNDLPRIEVESGVCLAYAPTIVAPVHNANLLGAAALLRAWKHSGNQEHYDLAKKAVNWSVERMNADGSWFYGDKPMLRWIDNYHTAYNLDCLCLAHEIGGNEIVAEETIQRTYAYWRDHFFKADGRPKFHHDRLYPIDIQATAQAIESLAKYSVRDEKALEMAWRTALWAIADMQKINGAFRYRIRKYWSNNLEAIHWGQGTMLSALGHLLFYTEKIKTIEAENKQVLEVLVSGLNEKIVAVLRSPNDLNPLKFVNGQEFQTASGEKFPISDGVVCLLPENERGADLGDGKFYEENPFGLRDWSNPDEVESGVEQDLKDLLARTPTDALIADVGAGTGRVSNFMSMKGFTNVASIDYSLASLRMIRKNSKNLCVWGNNLHLPLADNAFDLVISTGVIHHTPDPQKALAECARIVKPGGLFYLKLRNIHSPYGYLFFTYGAALRFFERQRALRFLSDIFGFGVYKLTRRVFYRHLPAREDKLLRGKYKNLFIKKMITFFTSGQVKRMLRNNRMEIQYGCKVGFSHRQHFYVCKKEILI